MSNPTAPTYKTENWPAYNKAFKHRGSLTVWFDPGMIWGAEPSIAGNGLLANHERGQAGPIADI